LALALLGGLWFSSGVAAQGVTPSGSKGQWYWNGVIAATDFKHGLSLKVLFMPESGCNDALFVLTGNDQITAMRFTVDGHGYNSVAVEHEYVDDVPMVGFVLSDSALYDLKHGYRLTIDTDAGQLVASLSGTALAFNNAYGNCQSLIEPPTLQATPPRPSQHQAKANPQPDSGGDKLSVLETDHGASLVLFQGDFAVGDGQRVIEVLRETGAPLLVLESGGGLVSEAQMIGYYLRSNNVDALAGGLCASACTFALAGGIERGAVEEARIGIHRSTLLGGTGSVEDGQQMAANYLRYFRSMGVDPELVAIAGSAASDHMHWLSTDEAIALGLIHRIVGTED
jgi:hypothetical protein